MRLLQLAMGHDEILDLHPLVSVVSGIDAEGRRRLSEVVEAMATGAAMGHDGLLEAHGVMFDLTADMLELLDINAGSVHPVVTAADLPSTTIDPKREERRQTERALVELDARRAGAREAHLHAQAAVTAAREAVARARAQLESVGRLTASLAALRGALDDALEHRRVLDVEHGEAVARAEGASARRVEAAADAAVRLDRHREAVRRRDELARRVERLRAAVDPDAAKEVTEAAGELAQLEAEIAASVEEPAPVEPALPDEVPAVRIERIEARIDELEKGLAAFEPSDPEPVVAALAALRPSDEPELRPSPEAMRIAAELEQVEAEVGHVSGTGGDPAEVAAGRRRLDDARHALEDAELAVRNPELDRDLILELEQAHAELLDAIDKADSRFGGARAQRRVEALRTVENDLLDRLGFTSYSDYMMGYSLLNVDPAKEEALDRARAELSGAEDVWHSFEVEAEAELAHAEVMARRRTLLDEGRAMLGRPVPPAEVVHALRALRVAPNESPVTTDGLRAALEHVGLGLGDDELPVDDLVLVAEAWLEEATAAPERERSMREELTILAGDLEDARAAFAGVAPVPDPEMPSGPAPHELPERRLQEARERVASADERLARHRGADAELPGLLHELEAAEEEERMAGQAVGEVDALVAETSRLEAAAQSELTRVAGALGEAAESEADARTELEAQTGGDGQRSPEEEATEALAGAEAELAAATQGGDDAASTVGAMEAERRELADRLDAFGPLEESVEEGSLAEETEWYLLARLAAQRSVSLGGSLPLLVDDALGGLAERDLTHVLDRLERMAQAVQIIVVSDDLAVRGWAEQVGVARAAVVQRQSA